MKVTVDRNCTCPGSTPPQHCGRCGRVLEHVWVEDADPVPDNDLRCPSWFCRTFRHGRRAQWEMCSYYFLKGREKP